jgi:hypothetical protein
MKKRRIEVTRERWTQIRIESHGPAECPQCRGAPDLVSLPTASQRTGASTDDLNRVIRSGLLLVWEAQNSQPLVCLSCLRKLIGEKAI